MPFSQSPTAPASKPESEATKDLREPATETEAKTAGIGDTWHQERQVRLTAQRILAEHLRDDRDEDQRSTEPPSPRLWTDIRLDLAGAALIDFDLQKGVVVDADFRRATFTGHAWFIGATFSGNVSFEGAIFSGDAWFISATFSGPSAIFSKAIFSGDAWFSGATFGGVIAAWFDGATFTGNAAFDQATFGVPKFDGVTFSGNVSFYRVTLRGGDAVFKGVTFRGGAQFDREGNWSFEESHVLSPDANHVWPPGWCLGPDGSGGYTLVRANDEGRS